ncbi:MAG: rhodanese-like domain-containing protein [Phycisphaeraceae bacterium]|nr:rhodanese-like domain-containing protein [Phycisphaeraceae bacterium]
MFHQFNGTSSSTQPLSGASSTKRHHRSIGWLLLLGLPILPATVSWRSHIPKILALSTRPSEVDLAQALAWDRQQILIWVDARSEAAYAQQHIPGAVLLNEDRWDELFPEFFVHWGPELEVVVYCDSSLCDASHQVAERMRKDLQTDRVHVLYGGWEAWLKAQGRD